MSEVLDFFGPHDAAFYRCIKASGASGVARYLTNSPTDPRQITPQEVADAHAAGLDIHFAYEMSPTYAAYFTFAQGAEDCRQAQNRLAELGAPDGTVVYFAVDAPASTIPVAVLDDYFNGVESAATPRIHPGIYGFQAHIEYARRQFPNVGKRTWQTYGAVTGALDLWQHLQEDRCGVSVDVNDATVSGWKPQEVHLATPQYVGQSVTTVEVEVGKPPVVCEAVYDYGNGPRFIPFKVYATRPGFWPVIFYPPADPDADPTEDISAQPALFVVAAR